MPDFTLHTYKKLLETFLSKNYSFQTFSQYLKEAAHRSVILRHDVDARKMNSLETARLEYQMGIAGTYYFRMVPESFDEDVIRKTHEMGHEIGYHYEDLSTCAACRAQGRKESQDQLIADAIKSFRNNLEILRRIVPVKTICMHGSPLSRWDNRLLWQYHDYRDFGISGEPYFDLDFDSILYLTDTGRRWDGESVSVRDKALSRQRDEETEGLIDSGMEEHKDEKQRTTVYRFRSTFDIINSAETNSLPDKIMLTIHPQRWTNKPLPWLWELIWQNVKNIGKAVIVVGAKERRAACG
ncbi:MAG: hypothetical protein ACOXZU_00500 [Bacteroidales bacterium]|jgi:hypothetical protein|nr:hypothetical protein [Spirochaetota bacterium]